MSSEAKEQGTDAPRSPVSETPEHQPFIPPTQSPPEFTWPTILVGGILGIIFGASSLYLVLKIGMTVSASVPIAVLSITLFRVFSKVFRVRNTTILENNIVQTTGSAGESIAFGVGVTMPALLLLGFEMDPIRVMTVAVLGGLLGILMMIPLRRAFIVKQHGKLIYPEGTACAEVLVAGEKGGATAKMVFIGFGIAVFHKFLTVGAKLWAEVPSINLFTKNELTGAKTGLKGAALSGELSPELIGVGYLIGPRIACLMMAGAVLSYFALGPMIVMFGATTNEPVSPAQWRDSKKKPDDDLGLIRNMGPEELRTEYLRFIGAGAVAAGGIISMCRAIPLIISSVVGGLRDLRATRTAASNGNATAIPRTERDMPMSVVLIGSLILIVALAAVPQLGLGLSFQGIVGAALILLFGFLFVTVSSRLTGEVGSSSNPISGMTIATLLLVCMIFFVLGKTTTQEWLTVLTVAAVVCIASSNGGTTSQDLKTGFLVGATPSKQQWAILIGALTSALVIGGTMLMLNNAQTHYTKKDFPTDVVLNVPADAPKEKPGKPYDRAQEKNATTPGWEADTKEYRVVHVRTNEYSGLKAGRYLVDDAGHPVYLADLPISRDKGTMDNGDAAPPKFGAPQPRLFANIIEGILGGKLEWSLVIAGALIAIALELCGVSALPVAVGMYLPLSSSTPIFIGGLVRWAADLIRGKPKNEAESETSPGVLLSSGYIAGGTLCGLLVITLTNLYEPLADVINLGSMLTGQEKWTPDEVEWAKIVSVVMFGLLGAFLLWVGCRKEKNGVGA